jgi:hypothetical protein
MHTRKLLLIILTLFQAVNTLRSQVTTGEWLAAGVEFNLPKKFTFGIDGQARFFNNSYNLYKYQVQLDLGYELHKMVDLGFSYRSEWRLEGNGSFYYRDKMFAELKLNYPVGRFKLKDRLRFQRKTRTYIRKEWQTIPLYHIRNKFELSYNIPKNKITPSLAFETFFPLNSFINTVMDEYRVTASIKYPFNKKNSIKAGIMYARELYTGNGQLVIFRLAYTFKKKVKM